MSFYAGFDLGGTQLKYGIIDETGKITFQAKVDTPEKTENLMLLLKKLWESLKKRTNSGITTVGFGFPGIFSLKEQKIIQSPNYPNIDNFELLPALSRFIDVPFCINNDANMAAFGEYKSGAGQGTQSMIHLTIGTGVGSGIILGGKLWQGVCGFAGELGHAVVNPEGDRCNCGSQGCLETEASAPKISKNYKALSNSQEEISTQDIFRRAKQGDIAAQKSFALAGRYLGIGFSIAINLFNPEKILLGGGVMKAGNFLLSPALKETRRRCYKASFECCSIERAILGNKAGFIGSAFWAKEQVGKTLSENRA